MTLGLLFGAGVFFWIGPRAGIEYLSGYLLELSRRGIAGAYALGTGGKRKVWVFRLSELAASVVRNETSIPKPPKPCTIGSGSPR